jgi:hypothetical protein
METIATYRNIDDGIEARIADGNARFNYRVVVRDIDADETITIQFCNTYARVMSRHVICKDSVLVW